MPDKPADRARRPPAADDGGETDLRQRVVRRSKRLSTNSLQTIAFFSHATGGRVLFSCASRGFQSHDSLQRVAHLRGPKLHDSKGGIRAPAFPPGPERSAVRQKKASQARLSVFPFVGIILRRARNLLCPRRTRGIPNPRVYPQKPFPAECPIRGRPSRGHTPIGIRYIRIFSCRLLLFW